MAGIRKVFPFDYFCCMDKFRYLVKLAFDGAPFHGWQVQSNAISVQEVITNALEVRLQKEKITLVGCGRTDTGVHASEFYAHFDLDENLHADKLDELTYRLNKQLPNQIVIFSIRKVPYNFHARFSALSRTYRYYLHNRKDPFLDNYSWCLLYELDLTEMNRAASMMHEYEDFTSFARLHSQTETNICKVERAQWEQDGHKYIFTITADRFLRNMVRAVVGTLVEVGRGKRTAGEFRRIIEIKDRSEAGKSAPARGLFLEQVLYPGQTG